MTTEEAYLCTPRDWQLELQQQALNWLGTPDAEPLLMHAKRYGLCATVIEAKARRIAELEAAMTRMAGEARELME